MKKLVSTIIIRSKYSISIILVCLFCTSCLPLTSNGFKKIKINYSENDVINIIGRPTTKNVFYSKEYMVYYVYDSIFSLFLNRDVFPYVGFYPLLRTGTEYWVILDNNKVVAFGPSKKFNSGSISRALDTKGSYIIDISGGQ